MENILTGSPSNDNNLEEAVVRKGEYSRNGDFHRNLDPNWSYYPIYLNKMALIDTLLSNLGERRGRILDAGCGEGVLVEKYAARGWEIVGIDKNYSSSFVREGTLTDIPFDKGSFETVLCLDVLEHLTFQEQKVALRQVSKVLTPGGTVLVSIPNLAHFTARLKFMFRGQLLRTASYSHHPGDRPAWEYRQLLEKQGFQVERTYGIFPTVPPIYRWVMRYPGRSVELLRRLQKWPFPPYWCFQVIFVCRKISKSKL